jgi:NAD(P)H dehydrogenase (quinone)
MWKLAIVYFSVSNKTHLMAEAIAEGCSQVLGVKVELLRIVREQIVNGVWQNPEIIAKLNQADAIVFGSPTYMGGVAGEFKQSPGRLRHPKTVKLSHSMYFTFDF